MQKTVPHNCCIEILIPCSCSDIMPLELCMLADTVDKELQLFDSNNFDNVSSTLVSQLYVYT
uniref:Uncharacterized protein n=1 Tax=Romanomermis culicivorax TaxID=13658 RepID=A0A915K2M2_ROMCU